MFDTIVELMCLAASNSLVIFCFCNLIIIMILMVSKPASANFDLDSELPRSMAINTYKSMKEEGVLVANHNPSLDGDEMAFPFNENKISVADKKMSIALEEPTDGSDEESENDREDADDELRTRVEEFINKVNREWRAESLRTSY